MFDSIGRVLYCQTVVNLARRYFRLFSGFGSAVSAWCVVVSLAVVAFGWMPESPFGGSAVKNPWSKCGQTMCSCQPDGVDLGEPEEPACPLCITAGADAHRKAARVSWTRRAERIDNRVPLATGFLSGSLVMRLWSEPARIEPPAPRGAASTVEHRIGSLCVSLIDPPPPRACRRSA